MLKISRDAKLLILGAALIQLLLASGLLLLAMAGLQVFADAFSPAIAQGMLTPADPLRHVSTGQPVERILTEWQELSSKIDTLEVGFRATGSLATGSLAEKGPVSVTGRLFLAKPNLALFTCQGLDEKGNLTAEEPRFACGSQAWYDLDPANHTYQKTDHPGVLSRPPDLLCQYFLFGMTTDRAWRDHDWEILEESDSQVVLRANFKKQDEKTPLYFSEILDLPLQTSFDVYLDRKTFQTKKVVIGTPPDSAEYIAFDTKINPVLDLEPLRNPKFEGWTLQKEKLLSRP